MTNLKIFNVLVLAFVVFLMTGCARIFSAKYQKVKFESGTPGATIRFKDDSIGTGTAVKKINKNKFYQSVSVEKSGYQTLNYPFQIATFSPVAAFSVIDFATLILAPLVIPFDLDAPRVHKFRKVQKIPALVPLRKRQSKEKYLWAENTALIAKAKDIHYVHYKSIKSYRNSTGTDGGDKISKKIRYGNSDVKISNTIFTDELNSTLNEMNYVDTVQKLFANTDNSLYLDATIKKVTVYKISRAQKKTREFQNQMLGLQLEIEWKVLDYYKQPVCTIQTVKKSDIFTVEVETDWNSWRDHAAESKKKDEEAYSTALRKAIGNNFSYALSDIVKELDTKNILQITGNKVDTAAYININLPPAPGETTRLNEMLRSSVSVKVDDGHGSGIIISDDGYIVTNYHVIAGAKSIDVIFNDDSTVKARVIKVNSSADLALLKVDKGGLKALPLSETKDAEIGIDVWAIGTPKNLELGQSLSRGIISGIRKANELSYIQTDAKISPGNSGGALINRKGEVLGIVSSKLIGIGTEGVGFAITAYQVLEKLKIKYK